MKREESCSYVCDGVEVKQLVSEFCCFSYLCIGPSHGTFLVVIQVVSKFRMFLKFPVIMHFKFPFGMM